MDNKVAFVTGSASGIVREPALLFAKEGAKVTVGDSNEEVGKEAIQALEQKHAMLRLGKSNGFSS